MPNAECRMPLLIAIGGHCGTGKSTLGFRLARECEALRGALVLDFDAIHREVLGYELRPPMRPEDYTDEITERVRIRMDGLTREALAAGRSVIDATGFFSENWRQRVEKLATDCGVPFRGIWLVVPIEEMERRIIKRRAERRNKCALSVEEGHASDGCLCVLDKFGDIGVPQSKAWTVLDASGPLDEVLEKTGNILFPPTPDSRPPTSFFHTDIASGDWIDRRLPPAARPYARLMRLDRPIGTWLLLWPCFWSATLAAQGGWPNLWHLFLFALGSIVMRGAGCVVNDLYDRKIDRQVERTRVRPLASGVLSVWRAAIFLVFLLLVGLVILLQFNALTVWVGVASLALVFTYPLAKRFTYWPQLVLGLTFNWGALLGWTAARGELSLAPLALYTAGVFWTLGYDTIYAHQDKRDDALVGIKSLALYLGDKSRSWLVGFYAAFFALLASAGASAGLGPLFYALLPLSALHAVWQLATWKMDDPANCLKRFRSNRDFGLLVWIAILVGALT